MGAPISFENNEKERSGKETNLHEHSINLQTISIFVMLFVGGATIFLGVQTGFVLDEIRDYNRAQFEIENYDPIPSFDVTEILLYRNNGSVKKYDFEGIHVDAISPHPLRFSVLNSTMKQSEAFDYCLFDDPPDVSLWRTNYVYWNTDEESKILEVDLIADYKISSEYIVPSYRMDEKTIKALTGGVEFWIEVIDLQTKERYYHRVVSDIILKISHDEMDVFSNC